MAGSGSSGDLPLFLIDAFAAAPFAGNPAAVVLELRDGLLDDSTRQRIAAEMNQSETAFVSVPTAGVDENGGGDPLARFRAGGAFGLRWFTPTTEVPLCGHATLAAAHVLFSELGNASEAIHFDTLSGRLTVRRQQPAAAAAAGGGGSPAGAGGRALLRLDFPSLPPSLAALPPGLRPEAGGDGGLEALIRVATGGLGAEAVAYSPPVKYLLLLLPKGTPRAALEALAPDPSALAAAAPGGGALVSGVIVAAEGGGAGLDFVSRFFAPWMGINEDPVTGSAHCVLAPFFAERLGKTDMAAFQCSPRGGAVWVRLETAAAGAPRVCVSGGAVTTVRGGLALPAGSGSAAGAAS
ncbi:hypothetical protein Rsub_06261 [Raphidocelis subcapitata]|uniref:Phenazine biosynthesis-like domain-containing protein n=1 Tax=Raphidocelis subcapitata TaxID=307507 RepID=A0A2V0P0Y8_9CHLO|nr:hypothetical protein Rsub_06261 [Raphidocelis subcapitata]|eukprot:GBF93541.1 hypothetical protein Rsub_06261 [Raphidocelis subcapitata]